MAGRTAKSELLTSLQRVLVEREVLGSTPTAPTSLLIDNVGLANFARQQKAALRASDVGKQVNSQRRGWHADQLHFLGSSKSARDIAQPAKFRRRTRVKRRLSTTCLGRGPTDSHTRVPCFGFFVFLVIWGIWCSLKAKFVQSRAKIRS
jgi:hypothetical protein